MGLPCAHIIKGKLWEGMSLTVDDFNAHWNIKRGVLTPVDYRQLIQAGASDPPGQASYQSFHKPTSFPL
jgi:hypothetical protein